jgi:carbon-monoxide dehydrogenase large subunit
MIGKPVTRREDARVLRGETEYLDDVQRPGEAHVAFVRSPYAHARISAIETPARADGLVAVLTASDLDGLVRPFPVQAVDDAQLADEAHPVLPVDEVRYAGQPVVAVVAATRAQAEDIAELVDVEYEPLEAVVDARASDGALMRWSRRSGDVDAAFAAADHVASASYALPRLAAVPIEPRGAIAEYDAERDLVTVWCSVQDPHRPRHQLAHILGRSEEAVRVIVPDVGGAFGSKGVIAPEVAVAAAAAIMLGRPIKWAEDRLENLLASYQGRGIEGDVELALDRDGRMLAVRARLWADLGGYLLTTTAIPPHTAAMLMTGCYDIAAAEVHVVGARTHKVPTGPYRGAGRPDAAYMIEGLVDQAARELGIDRIELRRRNLIRSFPHRTPLGHEYDSGDYVRCLELAQELGRLPDAAADGVVSGTGLAMYVERAGGQWESAEIELVAGGRFVIASSASPHGQGHDTTFAQIASDRLGCPPEQITLRFGDSAAVPRGVGTFGSRSTAMAGSAIVEAIDRLTAAGASAAAALLAVAAEEVRFERGTFSATGDRQRAISWAQLAPAGLRCEATFASPLVFSSGAYAAAVEIDPATGRLSVTRIAAVDDAGTLINPLLVHGQILGGAVQALGECLTEEVIHDDGGQNLSGSLLSYSLLTAAEIPPIVTGEVASPSPHNPLGAKGAGEGGAVGTLAAVANAVADALGGRHLDPPYHEEKLWRALQETGRP